ncbi:hypothetical protein [Ancylobacter sp.]|uniref:hypothetical protein n=1 Tax=Ancylobacter sp. TaxID=1872567 RepID=UPI003BADA73D
MMSAKWKDITSYSRDDKERVPSTWELRLTPYTRIFVMRSHRADPDNWTMHCGPWFDTYPLGLPSKMENRDEAMSRALNLVADKIEDLHEAIAAARTLSEGE